jgi:hypothetical protein
VSVTESDYTETELAGKSRSELDEIAGVLGLDPADYDSKKDEVAAILSAQAEVDASLAETNGETQAGLVPAADASTQGEPTSFAGVDISTLNQPEAPDAEHILLSGEAWVKLGQDPSVPEWAVGNPASVVSAPVTHETDDNGNWLYDYTAPDAMVTVRERSQGAIFTVPLSSCLEVFAFGGRSSVVDFP